MRVVAQERNRKRFRVASAQALKGDRERQAGVAGVRGGVAWEGLVGKPHNKMRAVECHKGLNLGGVSWPGFLYRKATVVAAWGVGAQGPRLDSTWWSFGRRWWQL